MLEDFINAFKNFKSNKTRTFLSLLGVIIGVASVIVITSMGSSSTKQIADTFGTSGLDVVSVSAGFMSRRGSSSSVQFNETARTELFDNIKNIKKIWYKNSLNATMSYGETSSSVNCSAIETGYLEMYNLEEFLFEKNILHFFLISLLKNLTLLIKCIMSFLMLDYIFSIRLFLIFECSTFFQKGRKYIIFYSSFY